MVNVENINQLIETIEKAPAKLSIMGDYNESLLHNCGTAHCIGGWAMTIGAPLDLSERAEWYGLSGAEASDLEFMHNDVGVGMTEFDEKVPAEDRKQIMINVLRHLVKTGVVDWDSELLTTELIEEPDDDGY